MNKKVIKKLLEADNEADIEIGALLLEGDNLTTKQKKAIIKKYIEDNLKQFNEKERTLLDTWLKSKKKNNLLTQNFKLWILKDR